MRGMPGIAVPEPVLDQPQVVLLVRKREAAGMAQHMRVDVAQARAVSGGGDQVVHRLPGHRLAALGDEEPGQVVVAAREPPADGAQLVTRHRVLDAEPVLEPRHPEAGLREVDVVAAQGDRLGDPQAVAVRHQHQEVVAHPVPAALGGGEQPVDLRRAEIVAAAFVGVRSAVEIAAGDTLDTSTVGHGCAAPPGPLPCLDGSNTTLYTRHLV